ncbi:putative PHD type zinc finger protein with BAH domain-containing protein [Cryptotrichosporon argae]
MVIPTFATTSAKLANGEVVHVNDHVYMSPPWSDRDGTPYTIARIIEFLPGSSTPKKGVRQSADLRVRLSLYYRPSDISGRANSDARLLLAAIHTAVEPLSSVRGRCHVRHKDKIDDLLAWKRNPDSFYFVKFFDPYIKREYEVVRTSSVNNIPPHVKEVLLQRYEYLIAEKEMVPDLLDAYHACCVCSNWAASLDSVACQICKQYYHMACLNPPLAAKPAKGYSWSCLSCVMQHRRDVESEKYRFATNAPAPAGPRQSKSGAARAKDKAAKAHANDRPDVTYRGWPWRYFGLYTHAEDTLDPDDQIFPRAVTRVGPKFQATVPTWEEQQAQAHHAFGDPEAGPSRLVVERGYDPDPRKHEATIDVLSRPADDLEAYMQDVAKLNLAVPSHDVERLNRAISAYTTLGRDAALQFMRRLKPADFHVITFTKDETEAFEHHFERYGDLEVIELSRQLKKRPGDVLRFHYVHGNKKLKAENEAARQHRKVHAALGRTPSAKTLGAPSLGKIRRAADSDASDDEVSLYGPAYADDGTPQCAACATKLGNVWWRCPRILHGEAMCETCGSNYRKYGVISFTKAEDSKLPNKDKAAGKRAKSDAASGTATPVPAAPPKLPPCACCRRMEPKATMARCKTCTFSVHAGCYGILPEAMGPGWECELCLNVTVEGNNLEPRCVLCPRDQAAVAARVKRKQTADFDLLSALKPTEGCQWAHVLCSAWIPECQYTSAATLKAVERISLIARERFEATCTICAQPDGAKIGCGQCDAMFHPSCAWMAGYRFGFQFALAKAGRREAVTIARFKDETGVMISSCYCKAHAADEAPLFDMYELDPELNETALQVYTASYKTVQAHDSFALLRKAQRLDALDAIDAARAAAAASAATAPAADVKPTLGKACAACGIDVSPRWHADGQGEGWRCHQCHHFGRIEVDA